MIIANLPQQRRATPAASSPTRRARCRSATCALRATRSPTPSSRRCDLVPEETKRDLAPILARARVEVATHDASPSARPPPLERADEYAVRRAARPRADPPHPRRRAAVRGVRARPARARALPHDGVVAGERRAATRRCCSTRAAASATRPSRWARRARSMRCCACIRARATRSSRARSAISTRCCATSSLDQRQTMIRMQVTADTFRPPTGVEVRRLTGARRARRSTALYRTDGVPSFYSSRQIDDSVYFGVERDGVLVAVAGTHVISQRQRDRRRRQRLHAPALSRSAPGAGDDERRDGSSCCGSAARSC